MDIDESHNLIGHWTNSKYRMFIFLLYIRSAHILIEMSHFTEGPMSMSSMSMSMSMSMYGGGDELLPPPHFVEEDVKYTCVHCHKPLSNPQQTACGHRLSKECVNQIFEEQAPGDEPPMCPANEEGCEVLTPDTVHPDFSAAREMKQLLVYCAYRQSGCKQTTTWRKFKDHYAICTFRLQPCHLCDEPCAPDKLQLHIDNECPMVSIPCPFKCIETPDGIKRSEMERHLEVCTARLRNCIFEKIGCLYEGNIFELKLHEEELKMHLQLLLDCIDKQQIEIQELRARFQQTELLEDLRKDHGEGSSDLVQAPDNKRKNYKLLSEENNLLKESLATFTEQLRETEQKYSDSLRTMNDKLSEITSKLTSLAGELEHVKTNQSQVKEQDNKLEITISRLVWNYHCLSTASYDGVLLWCLKDYQLHKRNEKTRSLYSQPFYTSRYGYRMCARVYLNGEGQGRGNYVSLFFVLMQGDYDDLLPWPFRQTVTLSLVNQDGGANKRDHSETFRPDPASSSFEKPKTSMNIATGSPLFIRHDALENRASPYLKNDTLYFRVSVDVRGINAG